VHVPQLQSLLQHICHTGFEHHVAMNRSHYAASGAEALESYFWLGCLPPSRGVVCFAIIYCEGIIRPGRMTNEKRHEDARLIRVQGETRDEK
jgi:hypothetical protein